MSLYGSKQNNFNVINKSVPRIDGFDKITGRAIYAADIVMPNMLHAGVLRSGRAHARVLEIDTSKAKAIPGVCAVLTADDLPKSTTWCGYEYLTNHVRHGGDCVAMVAAETRELVDEALEAIEVKYEDLPVMGSIQQAFAEGAALIHDENGRGDNLYMPSKFKLRKGDVSKGFEEADVIIEREYETQHQEHGYIEPEAAVAVQNPGDGQMTVYASAQNPFFTRRYVADILQAPINEVRIFQQNIGGSFGGKEESIGLVAARAAYLCKVCKRPVKLVFTREETMMESVKRHPYVLKCKMGLKKDGTIVALENEIYVDAGAYNNQAQFVNWKACAHSAGVYSIPNVKTDIVGVYTNKIMGGAFRGFGNPQVLFALEQLIEEAAEEIGMDPVAIRKLNCVEDGKTNGVGQVLECVTLKEIIDYSTEKTDYLRKHEEYKGQTGIKRKGIGMVSMLRGCGTGCETPDASGAMITVMEDGSILINSGLAENGQGLKTVYAQIAAEAMGVPYESIRFYGTDTHSIPDGGMTVASRGTTMGAQSMRKAGLELREILLENAAEIMKVTKDELDLKDGVFYLKADPSVTRTLKDICGISLWSGHQMGHYSWYKPSADLHSDHETGQGKVWPQYAYGVIIAEVEVDMETGYVDVQKLTCSHDLGTVINPALALGQICGGALQGMGYGTTEDFKFKNGMMQTLNFDKYIVPTAMDMPEFDVNLFECDTKEGTYGAKSIGEPSLDGIAAAIANAVYNATGKRVRRNPCSMEQVLLGKELN